MNDETVDCFNCGRANPEWAQVCRSCGVPLRHGEARVLPSSRIPTDQASLISIGAVVGTILLAVFLGLFVSNLNPTDPTVGQASPTPSVAPSVAPSTTPEPVASDTPPPPTPTATPALPGTVAFGTELDGNGRIVTPVETYTPGQTFAYSVEMPGTFGADSIENEIAKLEEGGETVVLPRQAVGVDAGSTTFGYVIGDAGQFLGPWGPGEYEWRVYVNGTVVARGTFGYAEG